MSKDKPKEAAIFRISSSVNPKYWENSLSAMVKTSTLFISEKMDSLLISVIPVSTIGGILHIVGQCAVGCILISYKPVLFYAPWLLISGTATGLLLGVAARGAFNGIERYERRTGA